MMEHSHADRDLFRLLEMFTLASKSGAIQRGYPLHKPSSKLHNFDS